MKERSKGREKKEGKKGGSKKALSFTKTTWMLIQIPQPSFIAFNDT